MSLRVLPYLGTAFLGCTAVIASSETWRLWDLTASVQVAPVVGVQAADTGFRTATRTSPNHVTKLNMEVILARPLFSEGRRPFEAEVEPLPVEEEEPSPAPKAEVERIPPNFKILGVLMETSSPKALLALDDADAKWMQVGETVAAWEISAIGVDWVELTFGTRILVLELFE